MHVGVDKARRDDQAGDVVRFTRLRSAAARMHACDHRPDHADVGLAQFERGDVEHAAAGQQQVERRLALGRGDGLQSGRLVERVEHAGLAVRLIRP